MKKIFLFLCIALFFISCQKNKIEKTKTDWYQDQLTGSVKTIRTESAKLSAESANPDQAPRGIATEKKYNASGLETEELYFHPDGSLLSKASYTYASNRKTARLVNAPNGNENEKTVYEYDKGGNLIEEASYKNGDMLRSRIDYNYDEKNNRTESQTYNARGVMTDRWVYTYDANGLKNEESRYYVDGSLDTKFVYTFDARGNIVERAKYNAKNELLEKESYKYEFDNKGNWLKKVTSRIVEGTGKTAPEDVEATYRTISYF